MASLVAEDLTLTPYFSQYMIAWEASSTLCAGLPDCKKLASVPMSQLQCCS